jgi:single-strand selective monofunctional uracil DNA glycosylase
MDLVDRLSAQVTPLRFGPPVTHVYNPLDYARETVADYVAKYGQGTRLALFLGMNPGPFGMAQTGVPFGEVSAVRDWLGIRGQVGKPPGEHPARAVEGFACHRREVSGERLWGFLRAEFGAPEAFFRHAFVWNYCPLLFSAIGERNGRRSCRNLTPDKLDAAQAAPLFAACDQALADLVALLEPRYLVGVGAFAEASLRRLFGAQPGFTIGRMLHPSPASPLANRDFAGTAKRQLVEMGLWEALQTA